MLIDIIRYELGFKIHLLKNKGKNDPKFRRLGFNWYQDLREDRAA